MEIVCHSNMDKVRGDPADFSTLIKKKIANPHANPSPNSLNFSMKNLTNGNISNSRLHTKSPSAVPPSTKNIGVGTAGRHSSHPPVPLGHGHLGSIHGPASVSISVGHSNANGLSLSPGSSSSSAAPSPVPTPSNSGENEQGSSSGVNVKKGLKRMGSSTNSTSTPTSTPPGPTASKIVSQNVNGTPLTGIPRTDSELQLFRVLQRANLLSYFDVMIELGGDDVQQLCEAGEEEFLEIMALIGMASKPLHVRRLQKALQEWMSNPALFQTPVLPPGMGLGVPISSVRPSSTSNPTPSPPTSSSLPPPHSQVTLSVPPPPPSASRTSPLPLPIRPIPYHQPSSGQMSGGPATAAMVAAVAAAEHQASSLFFENNSMKHKLHVSTSSQNGHLHPSSNSNSPNGTLTVRPTHLSPGTGSSFSSLQLNHSFSNGYHHHPPRHSEREVRIPVDQIIPSHFLEQRIRTASEPSSPAASESPSESGSSHSPVPFLQENELSKVAEAAVQIVKTLPSYVFEPQIPSKRKFSGDFERIMRLPSHDAQRVEEIRKMSTVYGRPDPNGSTHPNKRKFPKPLSMHEVCVNEAAAQLAKHVPALLTYRDELCALAKQVVRDAGLTYSTNHTHTTSYSFALNNNNASYSNQNQSHGQKRHSSAGLELSGYLGIGSASNGSTSSGGGSDGNASVKKMRMEGGANGIEIQEYCHPLNSGQIGSSPAHSQENAMQITPIRNLSRRSSPSEDVHLSHSPLPMELVTITPSNPSGSPLRRASSAEGQDLTCHGQINRLSPNLVHDGSGSGRGIIAASLSQIKVLPIKSEPAN